MTDKFVSIIIPTYKEWHLLVHCLSALEKQTYPKDRFEIIVVNNDPADRPPADFHFPQNCQLIEEQKPGSYAARNTALKIAKGDILGFTDSDCIPNTDWIANAVNFLAQHKAYTRVAGKLKIIQKGSAPTVVEKYNELFSFPQEWLVNNGGGSVTGNMFSYKHVFDAVGGFDETLMSMGDKFWGMKAQQAGFKIAYVEDVVVLHPARNFAQLVSKEIRHGGAAPRRPERSKLLHFFDFAYKLRPRESGLRFMLGRRKNLRIIDRLTIPLLRHYLMVVRAYETMRIQFGKQPNRT